MKISNILIILFFAIPNTICFGITKTHSFKRTSLIVDPNGNFSLLLEIVDQTTEPLRCVYLKNINDEALLENIIVHSATPSCHGQITSYVIEEEKPLQIADAKNFQDILSSPVYAPHISSISCAGSKAADDIYRAFMGSDSVEPLEAYTTSLICPPEIYPRGKKNHKRHNKPYTYTPTTNNYPKRIYRNNSVTPSLNW